MLRCVGFVVFLSSFINISPTLLFDTIIILFFYFIIFCVVVVVVVARRSSR